jgi:hypothetical protein
MKTKLTVTVLALAALTVSGQTNLIFPQLLSPANTVLMTNAEFRCYSGNRIFFLNDGGYRAFLAADLNSNVLVTLHTSAEILDAQQQALIDANQREWDAAHPAPPVYAPPVDDIFDRAKQRMDEADKNGDLPDTINRIIESLEGTYSETIENSILNGADGDGVARIERERDLEKKKILEYALPLLKKEADEAKRAEAVAQSNDDAFRADPIGYLKTHPDPTNSLDK